MEQTVQTVLSNILVDRPDYIPSENAHEFVELVRQKLNEAEVSYDDFSYDDLIPYLPLSE